LPHTVGAMSGRLVQEKTNPAAATIAGATTSFNRFK
jgi:hypothetical protein